MTPSRKRFIDAVIQYCKDKNIDPSNFTKEHFNPVTKISKTSVPWSFLKPYLTDSETRTYNLSDLVKLDTGSYKSVKKKVPVVKPKTTTDISSEISKVLDAPEEKEDSKILDKYDEEYVTEKPSRTIGRGVIVVTNPQDGGVIGVCRTFDTAWNVHKMFRFHDQGEITDMKIAEEAFYKKGYLVLKSGNTALKVLFELFELGI